MDEIKIEVTYNGRSFVFNDGLKAYIFHLGIEDGMFNDFGFEGLLEYVDKVYEVAKYPPTTWVEDVAEFTAENWEKLKDFCAHRIFDRFAENKPDGFEGEADEDYEDEDNDEDEDDEGD